MAVQHASRAAPVSSTTLPWFISTTRSVAAAVTGSCEAMTAATHSRLAGEPEGVRQRRLVRPRERGRDVVDQQQRGTAHQAPGHRPPRPARVCLRARGGSRASR